MTGPVTFTHGFTLLQAPQQTALKCSHNVGLEHTVYWICRGENIAVFCQKCAQQFAVCINKPSVIGTNIYHAWQTSVIAKLFSSV